MARKGKAMYARQTHTHRFSCDPRFDAILSPIAPPSNFSQAPFPVLNGFINSKNSVATMTMTNQSTARIKTGSGWVRVREIPPLTPTLSAESTTVKCGVADDSEPSSENVNDYNTKKSKIIRRPTPRYVDDDRQDESVDDEEGGDDVDREEHSGEEMGFEVEMSLGASGSTMTDSLSSRSSCSDKSDLDFPLEILSGSYSSANDNIKTVYNNFRMSRMAIMAQAKESAQQMIVETPKEINVDEAAAAHATIQESLENAIKSRRRKDLFVDVNATPMPKQGPNTEIKDETPKTNNKTESTKESNFDPAHASILSMKNRKKEGVAQTLATVVVVQEVESPVKQTKAHGQSSVPTVDEHDGDDDSSAQVDARWEMLQAKYARSTEEKASSSEDPNEQQWRDNLLDVNSFASPTSRSQFSGNGATFEDELIQDCVETGLPSPERRLEQPSSSALNFSDSGESSCTTPTHGNTSPKVTASSATNTQIPRLDQSNGPPSTDAEDVKFDVLERARIENVSSTLTGDDDSAVASQSHHTLSPLNAVDFHGGSKIGADEQAEASFLRAISSGSEIEEPKSEPSNDIGRRELFLPKRSLLGHFDEHIRMPKIEIALAPSASSCSEQSMSEISESSCAKLNAVKQVASVTSHESEQLNAFRRPTHEEEEDPGFPKCRMQWWRKNGKKLVTEILDSSSTLRKERSRSSEDRGVVKLAENHVLREMPPKSSGDEQNPGQVDSLFKESSSCSSGETPSADRNFESAFKRGLSKFETGKAKAKSPISAPTKKKWRPRSTKKTVSPIIASDDNARSEPVHAPQPNSDADSSNSVHRRQKIPSGQMNMGGSVSPTTRIQNRRLTRPGHEKGEEADRALELVRSPRAMSDNLHGISANAGAPPNNPPRQTPPHGRKESSREHVVPNSKPETFERREPSIQRETPLPEMEVPPIYERTLDSDDMLVKKEHGSEPAFQEKVSNKREAASIHQHTPDNIDDLLAKKDHQPPLREETSEHKFFPETRDPLFDYTETTKAVQWQVDDDFEDAANILDVTSTSTSGTSMNQELVRNSRDFCPTPIAVKAERFVEKTPTNSATELVISRKHGQSFDAKAATGPGFPSWRIKPAESLADFTIQIYCTKSDTSELYHVHKHILGVGPRRSEYLERIFRSRGTATTKITLVDESSAYVSNIFDFVYCHDLDLELDTQNVMVFRYLAGVFQISPILKLTAEFILDNLTIANMSTYITESSRYRDDVVTKMIAAKCGEEIESIDIADELWTAMGPILFLRVLSCPKTDRRRVSPHLSLLVMEYYALHKYEVDANMFQDLSSVSILPIIHRKAALPLLEICEEYGAPSSLQPLQKRCAQVMAYHWKTTSELDRKRLFALLRSLPSNFTVDFLEAVETGKATSLIDASISKVLRESSHPTDYYEHAESFTVEKLFNQTLGHRPSHVQADADRPLSWRMDPTKSFSDWKVKVKHRNDGKIDEYHVHKHILSVGQYKSTFFAEMFLSGDHISSRQGSTIIELADGPAELVPVVLDFIYSPDHDLLTTTRNAAALRFLSRVFGIWMLNKKVVEYVQRDMDLSNMLHYLEHADLYDDERITNIAIRKCAINIKQMDPESDLLRGIKPDFFGRVVASTEIDKSASCHINILIAKYFTLHDLDESLLGQLLNHVPMKEIDKESALQLLSVLSSVKSKGVSIFSDIRRRCANILIENWKEIRQEHREETFQILRTLDSELVADIFDAVEQEYHKASYESMAVQSKLVKRYRTQLAEAKTRQEYEITKLRDESELLMAELLEKQKNLQAELANFHDATSRRALRSSGGFAHTRISSPRPSPMTSSHQSFIPRLTTKTPSPLATSSNPEQGRSQQRMVEPTPRAATSTTSQMVEPTARAAPSTTSHPCPTTQPSLFGRVFSCGPSPTTQGQRPDTSSAIAKTMPSEQLRRRLPANEVFDLNSSCL